MTEDKVAVTELEQRMRAWIEDHTHQYLSSHGVEGHILDMEMLGGHKFTPTLLLRHVGRKSGTMRYAPVIYGCIGGNLIVIASRGGADFDPAWYTNIEAGGAALDFQIASQAFRGSWREAKGEEREAFLDGGCVGDQELRAGLQALIEGHAGHLRGGRSAFHTRELI